jgi:hypothetical protein
MWLRMPLVCLSALGLASGSAVAGPALDDNSATPPSGGASAALDASAGAKDTEPPVEYGVGLRLRGLFIPKGEIELFVERAGDNGSKTFGYGLEITRRRGDVELQLGVEFDPINPGKGVWIDDGDDVSRGDVVDVVLDRDDQPKPFGWITIDFTFLSHHAFNKYVSLRYGGGLGIGILKGELRHFDVVCSPGATNENPSPNCEPPVAPFNGTGGFDPEFTQPGQVQTPRAYDLKSPIYPVIIGVIGVQVKPTEKLTLRVGDVRRKR